MRDREVVVELDEKRHGIVANQAPQGALGIRGPRTMKTRIPHNSPYGTRAEREREERSDRIASWFPAQVGQAAAYAPPRGAGDPKSVAENADGLLRFLRAMRNDDDESLTAGERAVRRRLVRLVEHGE